MLPARAFLVKMILLQKVILLFKLKNPIATIKEVVFLVMDDACKRLFLTRSCWKKRSMDKTPPWTTSGTQSLMELVFKNKSSNRWEIMKFKKMIFSKPNPQDNH